MSVKLISKTVPIINGIETTQELLSYVARVSNASNQLNTETGPKLIQYLISHSEWSPLEMVDFTMEIETSRAISRQILRHRSFSFQEFSQRYARVETMKVEARLQDTKNRQSSLETADQDLKEYWNIVQNEVLWKCEDAYSWALQNGIAKEQARAVLPEGLTKTKLYMKGSLRSWYHYCKLRMQPSTQKEHQEIAKACWDIILKECPDVC